MNRKSISVPKHSSDLLSEEERQEFPFVFDISFNYRQIDRLAGFWHACGLGTEVLITGAGYALVLHLCDEADYVHQETGR